MTQSLAVIGEVGYGIARARIQGQGPVAYFLTWIMFPVFQVLTVALLYQDNQALRDYGVVAGVTTSLVAGALYNGGEILDHERARGTLGNLFLSPCPRFVWLADFNFSRFARRC